MRHCEIERLFKIPASHPYVSEVGIDPADHHRVTQAIARRPELKVLGTDDKQPDEWKLFVGCASHRAREQFEDWMAR